MGFSPSGIDFSLSIKTKEQAVLAIKTAAIEFGMAAFGFGVAYLLAAPVLFYAGQSTTFHTLTAILLAGVVASVASLYLYFKQSRSAAIILSLIALAWALFGFIGGSEGNAQLGWSGYLAIGTFFVSLRGVHGAFRLHNMNVSSAELKALYKKETVDLQVGQNHRFFGRPVSQFTWIVIFIFTVILISVATIALVVVLFSYFQV